MKSKVSVRSILDASSNGMIHYVKACLEDISPDTVILYHGTNDLKRGNTLEKIATDKVKKTKFSFQDCLSEMTVSIKDRKK